MKKCNLAPENLNNLLLLAKKLKKIHKITTLFKPAYKKKIRKWIGSKHLSQLRSINWKHLNRIEKKNRNRFQKSPFSLKN